MINVENTTHGVVGVQNRWWCTTFLPKSKNTSLRRLQLHTGGRLLIKIKPDVGFNTNREPSDLSTENLPPDKKVVRKLVCEPLFDSPYKIDKFFITNANICIIILKHINVTRYTHYSCIECKIYCRCVYKSPKSHT